jgi:hypothetical protein
VHITVELTRRSVARYLLFLKERDTRKRSALMNCYTAIIKAFAFESILLS